MSRWIALFSQTGAELAEVSSSLGLRPDVIMTNNKDIPILSLKSNAAYKGSHKALMGMLEEMLQEGDVVTLHGYLSILPENVLNTEGVVVYNGHPALISKYPELKGLDPQKRAHKDLDKYESIGCVIHKVVPEIDSGEIVAESSIPVTEDIRNLDLEAFIEKLHTLSVNLWVQNLLELLGR